MKHQLLILFALLLLFTALPTPASNAPPLQLAKRYKAPSNINQYFVSEKLDGIRGYWDGKQLLTRSGKVIHAPTFFTQDWPNIPFEGELWTKRHDFQHIMSIVSKKIPVSAQWKTIKLMMFDLPAHKGPFSERINAMKAIVSNTNSPYLSMVKQFKVNTNQALLTHFNNVVEHQGEGLMLHHENSYYHKGRTSALMKLKPFNDADAIVIKHIAGKGKYQDMLGALLVETPGKLRFKIGSGFSDQERLNPPPIGAIISYKFSGKTARGIPRFASYLRIRKQSSGD